LPYFILDQTLSHFWAAICLPLLFRGGDLFCQLSALMNLINLKRRSQTAIGVIIIDNIIIINASDFSMLYMTQKLQFIDGF